MFNIDIKNFYKEAVEEKRFNTDFWNKLKTISTEDELRSFIKKRVQPIAREMGYDFSVDELLNYEEKIARAITDQQLEDISGGLNIKNWALGGMVSLMALGAGIIGATSSTNAQVDKKAVTETTTVMETIIEEGVKVPKNLPDKVETEKTTTKREKDNSDSKTGEEKDTEILQISVGKNNPQKSKIKATKSRYGNWLYLKTGDNSVENINLTRSELESFSKEAGFRDISEIEAIQAKNANEKILKVNLDRDLKKLFSDSQEISGKIWGTWGMANVKIKNDTKELEKKTSSDLKITQAATELDLTEKFKTCSLNEEQKLYALQALSLQEGFAILQGGGPLEKLRFSGGINEIVLTEDGIRRFTGDHGDAIIECLYMLFPSNDGHLNIYGGGNRLNFSKFGGISPDLMAKFCAFLNDYRNGKIDNAETMFKEIEVLVENAKTNYVKATKGYQIVQDNEAIKLLHKYGIIESPRSKSSFKNAQIRMYASFLVELQKAVELEKSGSYPKYLIEHILMAYMIKALNTKEQIQEFYQEIVKQLAQNETSKMEIASDEKDKIKEAIKAEKDRIARLSEVINAVEYNELSPYKNAPLSNGKTYKIGAPGEDGNVEFYEDDFADCADITVRHLINLLVYSDKQNWDSFLPKDGQELEKLKNNLREVVDAINSKDPNKKTVKFFDLATRLKMFFLYQRGFIKGIDQDRDMSYRSTNGADDVTPLARTLWEYAICNMNKENLEDSKYFDIVYGTDNNIELMPGYINMVKLMWNIASALNLGGKTKLDSARENIEAIAKEQEYDENKLKEALSSTFSLFCAQKLEIFMGLNKEICELERDKNGFITEITVEKEKKAAITVNVHKGKQNLLFDIIQYSVHAYIDHKPMIINSLDRFKNEKYKFDAAMLLLKDYLKIMNENSNEGEKKSDYEIPYLGGFYEAFSGGELKEDDPFRDTELFKTHEALKAIESLRGEENNFYRIKKTLVPAMAEIAKKINVLQPKMKDGKTLKDKTGKEVTTQKTLFDIFYEKYLKQNLEKIDVRDASMQQISEILFGSTKKIYRDKEDQNEITGFKAIKISEDEVTLLLNNEELENLIIPSKVYDENGKELKVSQVGKKEYIDLSNLKTISFDGDFDDLEIMTETFSYTENLESVEFTGIVKNLNFRSNAFSDCYNMKTFVMPKSIASLIIEEEAFSGIRLTNLEIPNSVVGLNLESGVFKCCENFKAIVIPESVTDLKVGNSVLLNMDFTEMCMYVPMHTKGEWVNNLYNKDHVLFYSIENGNLQLQINSKISPKINRAVLESLAKGCGLNEGLDFKSISVKDIEGKDIKIILDDDLKSEFEESSGKIINKNR